MRTSRGSRSLFLASSLIALAGAIVALLLVFLGPGRSTTGSAAASDVVPAGPASGRASVISVGGATSSQAVRAGFLGLSLEFPAVAAYAGTSSQALNPVLLQLIRNLSGGRPPALRIGGDSTDWTWWPVPGMRRPAGVNYTLTSRWIAIAGALVRAVGAKAVLGLDLEADSTAVAVAEARALIRGLGRGEVAALELGNEPELYGSFIWDGSGVTGRPHGYDLAAFTRDFSRFGQALPALPLAGPAVGARNWFPELGQFLKAEPSVGLVTLHRYPLQVCYVAPRQPNYPTFDHLFSAEASHGLAQSVASAVQLSHARGVQLRIDEMNTVSCGGADGVSKSFGSALWVLDALFQMARVSVDGVNLHTYPGATYELFRFSRARGAWEGFVEPEYYGMLLFAQAAPPGSRLLEISWMTPEPTGVRAWATRAPDGRIRVVLINDTGRAQIVAVRAGQSAGGQSAGAATLERLEAPSVASNGGVTLGGQSFGAATKTGLLAGRQRLVAVMPAGGAYRVRLRAASAAMLTLGKA